MDDHPPQQSSAPAVGNTGGGSGAGPLVDRVRRAPRFGVLKAAVERSAAAAASLAEQAAGRALDRPAASIVARQRAETRVHVTGLRGSALVFLAEALRRAVGRTILVVCPDEESAEDTFSDVRTVSDARSVRVPERGIPLHRFELRENLAARGDRNDALDRIAAGEADVVVTSLVGFVEKTLPVTELAARRRTVRTGGALDLDEWIGELVAIGYDRVVTVEEPGQFAVRGSIVDVFDPAWDYPARVELFGDEVDSIRTFDLDSQRSIERVSEVTVLPAASVPFAEDAAARLRGYLAARGFDAALIERIAGEIDHSRHSILWRRYAPALGVEGALLDFFPRPPVVLFADVAAHNRVWRRTRTEFERAVARDDDDFPPLDLHDYVHAPDYFERYGVGTVWHWALAVEGSEADRGADADAAAAIAGAPAAAEAPDVFPAMAPGETVVRFATASHPSVSGSMGPLVGTIRHLRERGAEVVIYAETPTQRERLADILEDAETLVHLPVGWITAGFLWEEAGIAVLTDHQIFRRILARPRRRKAPRRAHAIRADHLQVGDFIVHVDYGIGRYIGLENLGSNGQETECLTIRYQGGDTIYVPLEQMHLVEKYVGKEGIVPQIDRLGSSRWQTTKSKAREAVEEIARDLLDIYAQREITRGYAFGPDTQWQKELEASFPYEETPHQLRATAEIKDDMMAERPMDRLVCGDVGYGKTEVAVRAAFKAAGEGKQVAVLVPTTLLAMQHFDTLRERLGRFPLRIEMLSRFVPPAEQKRVVEGLGGGTVDVVVGTHRLLSKDVAFKDLGLLVVDEEHRFGVKHKERLKQIAHAVDVLSLTATPIPRTLHMALSGLRNISVIDTPPRNRHPIKTEVVPFDEETIRRAILEEIARDGQVFFVHNRVQSIHSVCAFLERLVPGVRFRVAHGQMSERELERVVVDFMARKFDVLVSTMIIESGLDLPNVNTIIINRADRFGLAQLYQLRGRVGRRERQAYAYFLVPRQLSLTEAASKRLQAMEEFEELGSGYRLAMRDLEIRGAGNVLGIQQHGHVAAIGFEMYCNMLKDAVDELRGRENEEPVPECKVEAPYEAFLPAGYVEDPDERMLIYKRIARMTDPADVDALADEVADRFGPPPTPARNLLDLAAIKLDAARLGVALVQIREPGYRRRRRARVLDAAAEVPNKTTDVPHNVPHGRRGSRRLERLAERVSGGLGSRVGGADDAGSASLEFAPGRSLSPPQCGRLMETFGNRLLFKSGVSFGVDLSADPAGIALAEGDPSGSDRSQPLVGDVRNLLQVAYFSNRITNSPDQKQPAAPNGSRGPRLPERQR